MPNQNFTEQQFSYLARQIDYWTYFKAASAGESKLLKINLLKEIEKNIDVEKYVFQPLSTFKLGVNDVYTLAKINKLETNKLSVISDDFILRKINQNLKRIYKVQQADRFQIINNVKTLLAQSIPFHVLKLDIKSFYETIDREKILSDIGSSFLVSYQTKKLLNNFFSALQKNLKGLPRGINTSAVLSEYYLRNFDAHLKSEETFYFFARFVDDIIIFSTEKITKEKIKELGRALPQGLSFNWDKVKVYNLGGTQNASIKITYLGYEFECAPIQSGKRITKTRIAPRKIRKIKSRIVSSFLSHKENGNFKLLKDRLLFLTATYPLKTQRQKLSKYETAGFLHGGILYSYPLIDDLTSLQQLDAFLNSVLHSKHFKRVSGHLSDAEKDSLKRYSFLQGYKRKISRNISTEYLKEIIQCWS